MKLCYCSGVLLSSRNILLVYSTLWENIRHHVVCNWQKENRTIIPFLFSSKAVIDAQIDCKGAQRNEPWKYSWSGWQLYCMFMTGKKKIIKLYINHTSTKKESFFKNLKIAKTMVLKLFSCIGDILQASKDRLPGSFSQIRRGGWEFAFQ